MESPQTSAARTFPLDGRLTAVGKASTPSGRITDLTAHPRLGLRGPGVRAWCVSRGLPFPDRINRCINGDHLRVARLGRHEILILPEDGAAPLPPIGSAANVYDGYREETWAWFRFDGHGTDVALAQLTSADLRSNRLRDGDVIQTRLAGLDTVIITRNQAGGGIYDIFVDIASSDFLADVFGDRCAGMALGRPA